MAWYWALESGTFWFPAQVYNREVGGSAFYFVFASHPLEDLGRSCSGRDVAYPLDITAGETQFSSISLETVSCCCSARTVPPSLPSSSRDGYHTSENNTEILMACISFFQCIPVAI